MPIGANDPHRHLLGRVHVTVGTFMPGRPRAEGLHHGDGPYSHHGQGLLPHPGLRELCVPSRHNQIPTPWHRGSSTPPPATVSRTGHDAHRLHAPTSAPDVAALPATDREALRRTASSPISISDSVEMGHRGTVDRTMTPVPEPPTVVTPSTAHRAPRSEHRSLAAICRGLLSLVRFVERASASLAEVSPEPLPPSGH